MAKYFPFFKSKMNDVRKENVEDSDIRILPHPAHQANTAAGSSTSSAVAQRLPLTERRSSEDDVQIIDGATKRFSLASSAFMLNNDWKKPLARPKLPFRYSRTEACTSTPKRSVFTKRICVDNRTIQRDVRSANLSSVLYNLEEKQAYQQLILQAANIPANVTMRTPILKQTARRIPIIDLTLDEHAINADLTSKPADVKKLEIPMFKKPEVVTLDTDFKPQTPLVFKNSFAESLKDKSFLQDGFAENRYDRYSAKQQVRARDIEQTKKSNQLLEIHTRSVFEANNLERGLKRITLFDIEKEEEVIPEIEEEEKLPELPEEAYTIVDKALYPRPPQEVLVSGFNADIMRKDICTLGDRNWLNDEVINFYMELIRERGCLDNYPKVHTFNTFFYPKLRQSGYQLLKRWTKKVDIFAHDLIVIPIHLGVHWCMSILDMKNKHAHYFDSMLTPNPSILSLLMKYLEDESMDKKKVPYDTSSWKMIQEKDIPVQHNGYDCGVFACMFAEAGSRRGKFLFTQDDMPALRRRMVYEILMKKLLT